MKQFKEFFQAQLDKKPLAEARGALSGLIEKWMDANDVYNFEGPRGERNFTKLVNALGYKSTDDFFGDNSGAYEALINWIGSQRSDEWAESLKADMPGVDPED